MKSSHLVFDIFLLLFSCTTFAATQSEINMSGIHANLNAAQYSEMCKNVLNIAQSQFKALEANTTPATLDNVMLPYDELLTTLDEVSDAEYLKEVHPDEMLREKATECSENVYDFYNSIKLSRGFYERLTAIDQNLLKSTEKFMVKRMLDDFHRNGVDKDPQTRKKIHDLQHEITEIGNRFSANIRDDVHFVKAHPDQLTGLPEDFIKSHPAGEDGLITISTDYPDIFPFMTYAEDDNLRRRLLTNFRNRGYPANETVLKRLLEKRYELARLLGFNNWAEFSMEDKMIGSPAKAQTFLAQISDAVKAPVKRDLNMLLNRLQKISPDAKQVNVWQISYLKNLLRQEDYALDSKEVRQYFRYDKVRNGIFKLTEDLFSIKIRPWKTDVWYKDVEAYEMLENDKIIGRFYLDSHPRQNKYKHAAHWNLRIGIKNKQIPLSALATNFPSGLMQHNEVETFLHEFGHLLHSIFSGNQQWYEISGLSMEKDFGEAPSKMLEEWVWDYDSLKTFATNQQGETIPKSLVDKMKRTRNFALALNTARQILLAETSLNFYNKDPNSFELYPLSLRLEKQFNPYPFLEGSHSYCSFGHLENYSSNYYTYQWSLAIATDLFSQFKNNMHNREVANSYRNKVLGAAGSKPAVEFIKDFLGREFTTKAYIEKIQSL